MNSHRSACVSREIIREAQKQCRLTTHELAIACGVSQGILERALSGRPVGLKSIEKIAKKLDITVEGLIGKGQASCLNNDTKKIIVGVEPHLEEKLCRITNELNERYGIDDPAGTIRYLIMTYVLTAKVVHSEERGE